MKVLNLDGKRVCDITPDGKAAVIRRSDCSTYLIVGEDQKIHVLHRKEKNQ